jgi:hypothetical protein
MTMRASILMAGVVMASLAAQPVQADVQKFMNICGRADQGVKLCPTFALALTPPQGWREDKAASRQQGVQVMVPAGKTFGNAEALIYVKVSPRQKKQELADFIRVSQERWRKAAPDSKITALAEIARENGQSPFLPFRYETPSLPQQAHEIVAFGMDTDKDGNDYMLMAVMTGRSKKALEQADQPYKAFLRAH